MPRIIHMTRTLNDDGDIDRLDAELRALPDKTRTVVKLSLKGSMTLRQHGRLLGVLASFGELFVALMQWERHTDLAMCPDDLHFSDVCRAGFALTALDAIVTT